MTRRLVAGYLALTIVVLVVLMVPLGITHRHGLEQDLLLRMERDATVVASLIEEEMRTPTTADDAAVATAVERYSAATGARVAVTGPTGGVVADTDPPAPGDRTLRTRPEVRAALDGTVATGSRYSETLGTDLLYVAVPVAAAGRIYGSVRITYPASEVNEQARSYWFVLAGVAAITLAAVALLGWLIARWVSRPIARLEEGAAAMGAGDLATRVPEDEGPPEVRALARRFNITAGQLEQLVGAQEAFVADASHQLRTPLTAMRLRIENLGAVAGPAGEDDARAATDEVDRLTRMVDSLLALARAERGDAPLTVVDVSSLLAERVDSWTDLAAESGVAVEGDIGAGLSARMPDGVLEQVLDNLVDNAVEACGDGGSVLVRAVANDGHGPVLIEVIDDGPGMSDADKAHAFDRFWRAPTSRAGAGTGLGLPIVQRLVEHAGGSVRLLDRDGAPGLLVRVELPRA